MGTSAAERQMNVGSKTIVHILALKMYEQKVNRENRATVLDTSISRIIFFIDSYTLQETPS
jgi:hypothetical protein